MERKKERIELDAQHAWMLRLGIVILALHFLFSACHVPFGSLIKQVTSDSGIDTTAVVDTLFFPVAGLVLLTQRKRVARWIASGSDREVKSNMRPPLRAWGAWVLLIATAYFFLSDALASVSRHFAQLERAAHDMPRTFWEQITMSGLIPDFLVFAFLLIVTGVLLHLPRWRWLRNLLELHA